MITVISYLSFLIFAIISTLVIYLGLVKVELI